MTDKLSQLRTMTTVVADTGDLEAIRVHQPEDATTNPSLLLKVAAKAEYQPYLEQAMAWAAAQDDATESLLQHAGDKLAVLVGQEILGIVPGKVSTEVDARLSFDTDATIAKARKLIGLYEADGIPRQRVLIKIAATWEGIKAAEVLEREGIQCNLTLLFSFAQAVACAEAGVHLISPFVGRILDWYKAHEGVDGYAPEQDPGVQSVTRIYQYYKAHGYETVVMGASFRNTDEIEQLAGCDKLTISPELLHKLQHSDAPLPQKLQPGAEVQPKPSAKLSAAAFRWQLNEDAMATEKLADGIRRFAADQVALEQLLKTHA